MELVVLQKIALELNELLPRGYINKIHQPLPREVVLRVRTPGAGEKRLMISADPLLGRIHLTDLRIPNPPLPPRFCAYLRAHLQGAVITGVSCAEDDRVVRVEASRSTAGRGSSLELVLELLGRDSNIILINQESHLIMDCLHRIPVKETGARAVLPGNMYMAPPKRPGGSQSSLDQIEPDRMRPGITSPGPDGKRRLILNANPDQDEVFPTMNQAADAFFSPKLDSLLLEGMRRELAAPLKAKIRSLTRRIEKIEADRRRLAEFAARGDEGELLKANLRNLKKGMDRIEVPDWATGHKRVIKLEPALGPIQNMERIFKAAAKGKRGATHVEQRLKQTLEEQRALAEILFFVQEAGSVDELNDLADEVPSRQGRTQEAADKGRKDKRREPPYLSFATPNGRPVFVGKSARGNEFLLKKRARKGDLWFHVKDAAGAHVLLPQRDPTPASPADQAFAAGLAVHFSKMRGRGRVEVMVADAKDIQPIKGGVPGQVYVRHHWTMLSEEVPPDKELT